MYIHILYIYCLPYLTHIEYTVYMHLTVVKKAEAMLGLLATCSGKDSGL